MLAHVIEDDKVVIASVCNFSLVVELLSVIRVCFSLLATFDSGPAKGWVNGSLKPM